MRAEKLFTDEEKKQIEQAVAAAEGRTSGEIVPMIVNSSYNYPSAELIGAGSLALACGLTVSGFFGGASIWWFIPVFFVTFILAKMLISHCPGFKRKLISAEDMEEEVREKAIVSFIEQDLHQTRDRTGILILISLFERRVQVLADSGINAKVSQETWDQIVTIITDGLKSQQTATALCKAIERCGDLLVEHFPRRHDDTDELPNLIID